VLAMLLKGNGSEVSTEKEEVGALAGFYF